MGESATENNTVWAEDLANKSFGIIVLFLTSVYSDDGVFKEHTPMNYHLHILQYKDTYGNNGYICLDTSLSVIQPFDQIDAAEALHFIADGFIEKLDSMVKANCLDKDSLFVKSPAVLWDRFNQIKEESFISNITKFKNFTGADRIAYSENKFETKSDQVDSPFTVTSTILGDAKVSVVETRQLSTVH